MIDNTNGADFSVLPKDNEITHWQKCLKTAMLSIQRNAAPYARDKSSGVILNSYVADRRILKAAQPPTSQCVGATLEAFFWAWHMWTFQHLKPEEQLTPNDWFDHIIPNWFAYTGPEYENNGQWAHTKGSTGALLWLGKKYDWLHVEEYDPNDGRLWWNQKFKFGDTFNLQNTPDPKGSGHSALWIKNDTTIKGSDVAIVWSSNTGYDNSWLTKNQQPGHGFDWYNYNRTYPNGWNRKIYAAGIRNSGWPKEKAQG